ncbi:MAG: dTDP-4-dehydrorhamnose 3,5-epimerase [Chitinophagaceae bacterium]|nr:MAG: dTDP-4-dehydrorhamnose 3,5-epimerase [Chitinophagaceae bacterium]
MPFSITDLPGLLVYEPRVFGDNRGYFFESYNEQVFAQQGVHTRFVQDNQSHSTYGVIRGLHYQLNPNAQAKLIRVLSGRILDVVVDIRKGSRTFGRHFAVELSSDNKKQLFIPRGFAHGFSVLSDIADISYKCDNFYSKESEAGLRFDDPALGIDWQVPHDPAKVSGKDLELPGIEDCVTNFVFED